MHSWSVGNLARDCVLLQVHHHDLRRMREIQSMRRRIDIEDIPATFAPDRNLGDELIAWLRGCRIQPHGKISNRKKNRTHSNLYSTS